MLEDQLTESPGFSSVVSQLLRKVPSHLTNTNKFLELLRSSNLNESGVVESFDVTSLYTNVQNEGDLQALSEMWDTHVRDTNTFGFRKTHIITVVEECLKCKIFTWSGLYFRSLEG